VTNDAAVFLDSFFFIALLNRRDEFHVEAAAMAGSLRNNLQVTSEPVLTEVLNFFSSFGPNLRAAGIELVTELRRSQVQIEAQTSELFDAGLDLYQRRRDKDYSLTDCMSMHIATSKGITRIATHDAGFRQEGFNILFP
jgi:predicted nucleic acid-binding protein